MLISRLVTEFESYMLTERGASGHTITAYRSTLRRLLRFVEDTHRGADFRAITTAQLRRFISHIKRCGVSNATIARHVHAIRSFWRFVVETYDLAANAALPLRVPTPDHQVPEVLSVDESMRLIEAADQNHYHLYRIRDRVWLKLMLLVGLRRGEVLALRMADYDATCRKLRINMSKGRKSRVVPLPAEMCTDIDAWLQVRPVCDHDRLLTTRTGNPLSATCLYRSFSKLVEAAGLSERRITPHTLRHTAATLVLRNSRDLLATSRLLGHSSVAMTGDVYCHLTDEYVRRAVSYHPLAGEDTNLAEGIEVQKGWPSVHEDQRDVIAECEEMVAQAVKQYSKTAAANAEFAATSHRQSMVWAICHNVRAHEVVSPDVVRSVAWEGQVVEGYSLAEHQRIAALRDILESIGECAQADDPWSRILPDMAARITGRHAPAPDTWDSATLDEIGIFAKSEECHSWSLPARFSYVLAQVGLMASLGPERFLISQIAANIATHNLGTPLIFFSTWSLPIFRVAIDMVRRRNGSFLHAVAASNIADAYAARCYLRRT